MLEDAISSEAEHAHRARLMDALARVRLFIEHQRVRTNPASLTCAAEVYQATTTTATTTTTAAATATTTTTTTTKCYSTLPPTALTTLTTLTTTYYCCCYYDNYSALTLALTLALA
jgi:hypothetical protein